MTRVDDAILRVYTKLAHAWQRLTGRTCYWCAQQCAVLDAICIWIDRGFTWPETFAIAMWLFMACRAGAFERAFQADPTTLPRSVQYWDGPVFRALRLVLMLGFAAVIMVTVAAAFKRAVDGRTLFARTVSAATVVSFYYFIVVVPMPPARQRDRVRGTLIPHLMGAKS